MLSSINQLHIITCKAAVAWGSGEALVMEEVEVSPPSLQEIRGKAVSTSLCRSDLNALDSHGVERSEVVQVKKGLHLRS